MLPMRARFAWRRTDACSACERIVTAPAASDVPRSERLGDAALLLRFGSTIDAHSNRRVHACAQALRNNAPAWLLDLTPAYASLAVHVDVARIGGDDPLAVAQRWLAERIAQMDANACSALAPAVEIPVLYGGDAGPDLLALAAHAGMAAAEVVARHTASQYTVAMLGFAPGFAYLLGLDRRLAMPRHTTPRQRVAAGSVGIGGAQTGIYPTAGPGGWQIVGRTPLRLFDALRDRPALLAPGQPVRFVSIDAATFAARDEHPR